jgi:sec-independent protein translocase protein TatA
MLGLVKVLVVVMLLFGAKRLPEVGRSLGAGLRGFRESVSAHDPAASPQEPVTEPVPEQVPLSANE